MIEHTVIFRNFGKDIRQILRGLDFKIDTDSSLEHIWTVYRLSVCHLICTGSFLTRNRAYRLL